MNTKKEDLVFEEISDRDFFNEYSQGCSGSRSDCCTRVCTRNQLVAKEEDWCKFLAVDGGVVQY